MIAPASTATDVLFAGRLISEKRVDLLLNAIAIARTKIPAIRCAIIGDGPERASLEDLASKLGLDENVTFTGFVDQDGLTAFMKSSKVFVLPSVREGFGLVIIEANACKLPVISISHEMSAVRELVQDGVNGFLVSDGSPDEIADVIFDLVSDDALREQLAENGFEMSKKFAWSDISKSIRVPTRNCSANEGRPDDDVPLLPVPVTWGLQLIPEQARVQPRMKALIASPDTIPA